MDLAVHSLGRWGLLCWDTAWRFGQFVQFALSVAAALLRSPRRCLRWSNLGEQLFHVGTASIPVVSLTGLFIGMILALEGYDQFAALGQEERLGGVINISVVKQIGPVLAAVMIAGRVGGALAAELGTMRITEQLDAMRAMDADPIRILVAPRVVACIIMAPILTLYSDMLGVAGAWLVTVKIFGVAQADYWHFSAQFVWGWDLFTGLIKAVFFGGAIGLIACSHGFACSAGAAGVGRAATAAFVSSFVAIIALNLVLAEFLNSVFHIFHRGFVGVLD